MRAFVLFLACFGLSAPALASIQVLDLFGGDRLSGELVERTEDDVVIDHPVLGRIAVPLAEIERETERLPTEPTDTTVPQELAQNPPEVPLTAVEEAQVVLPELGPPGVFGTDFLKGWERRVSAGISASQGNTETLDASFALRLKRDDGRQRSVVESASVYSHSRGRTRKARGFGRIEQNWLKPEEPTFYFAELRHDTDRFQAWEDRLALNGGFGIELALADNVDVVAQLGLGGNKTFGGLSVFSPEAVASLETRWEIGDGHYLETSATVFPNLDQTGEFRTLTTALWSIRLTPWGKLSLQLGVDSEYNSLPVREGGKRLDVDYYTRFAYDF